LEKRTLWLERRQEKKKESRQGEKEFGKSGKTPSTSGKGVWPAIRRSKQLSKIKSRGIQGQGETAKGAVPGARIRNGKIRRGRSKKKEGLRRGNKLDTLEALL